MCVWGGGGSFQSLADLGKKEYIRAFISYILEKGIEILLRSEGVMLGGRKILTWPVWNFYSINKENIFLRFSNVGSPIFFSISVTLLVEA